MRRLLNLISGVKKSYYKIRITSGAKRDLLMWKRFLTEFNGVTFFQSNEWFDTDSIMLFTDAAGSIGFGAYYQGKWAQGKWPAWVLKRRLSIAALELFPIYVAIKVWGKQLANKSSF